MLARPGERRIWVLDAGAAILWDLRAEGWDAEPIASLLAERFQVGLDTAHRYVRQVYENWCHSGLLDAAGRANTNTGGQAPLERIATFPPPTARAVAPDEWCLVVAQRSITVKIDDPGLRGSLEKLLRPVRVDPAVLPQEAAVDQVLLSGTGGQWLLRVNGAEVSAGRDRDGAMVALLSALTELGCRTGERLLVAHGAGLVSPEGQGILLVAPGGSGKSTLAMALEAEGFALMSDDVVPINMEGSALGLGLPAWIKQGSWQVLSATRPELLRAPKLQRFNQPVRLLAPRFAPCTGAVVPRLILFPRYAPDAGPACHPMRHDQALQGIVEAEAVIRDLTQEKLNRLCEWVGGIPAYSLTYPNLAEARMLIGRLLAQLSACASA